MARKAVITTHLTAGLPDPVIARGILAEGIIMAKALADSIESGKRLSFARNITHLAVSVFWNTHQKATASKAWPIYPLPEDIEQVDLSKPASDLAHNMGITAARLETIEASYLIGLLYTATMPDQNRAGLGAYYTPPALCKRLIEVASEAGVDWQSARVLDPACGGGAFLAPVAQKMLASLKSCNPKIALRNIAQRLQGFEIDPFAAWMSHVFLEAALLNFCRAANMRLPFIVDVCNSLEKEPEDAGYDLVIGNPPYGRVTLPRLLRAKYKRSLFGHANLYGVFTDLALRFTRPGGIISYVTPTSFLAGEYYKALRGLLAQEAPPASIDFVTERKAVFADVLQETLLATYRRGRKADVGQVYFVAPISNGGIQVTAAGSFSLPASPNEPWLIPRTVAQSKLVRMAEKLPYRLKDYGYKVSTGPLVWNRHKTSLRDKPGEGRFPLIWAESVRPEGCFEFRAQKRNHKPFFEPQDNEKWLLTDYHCVLLQRTTAKEQARRLIAAELPVSFIERFGKVVIENHLNMIRPIDDKPRVSPATLASLLNTQVVDQLFRCLNGSVAVSAYELAALPLPDPDQLAEVERLITRKAKPSVIEHAVKRLYSGE